MKRYEWRAEVREQIDNAAPKYNHPCNDVEGMLELWVGVLASTGQMIHIGSEALSKAAEKERFHQSTAHILSTFGLPQEHDFNRILTLSGPVRLFSTAMGRSSSLIFHIPLFASEC